MALYTPVLDFRDNTVESDIATVMYNFDEVYDTHFDFVWRVVCKFGAADHVDDLVQQVFIIVMRKLPSFEGRSSIRTWLYTIVRRVMKDHFRSEKRRPQSEEFNEGTTETKESSPEEQFARKEDIQFLYQLLSTLDVEKKEVFVLVELEGMSITEISPALGVNENTLYSRLRAARRQFNESVSRYQAGLERSKQ